ncbi:hypothetical protein D3C78_1322720 [compost metagenome]
MRSSTSPTSFFRKMRGAIPILPPRLPVTALARLSIYASSALAPIRAGAVLIEAYRSRTLQPTFCSSATSKPFRRICTARGLSKRASVVKSTARRWARGARRCTPIGPSKKAGVPVITRYSPGKRPLSFSSISWRKAFRLLSRTSPRIRCRVSTSSSTSSKPGCPESLRMVSTPCRKLRAPKWSISPLICA